MEGKKDQLFLTSRLKENIVLYHFQSTFSVSYLSILDPTVFLLQGSQFLGKTAQIEIKGLSKHACSMHEEVSN